MKSLVVFSVNHRSCPLNTLAQMTIPNGSFMNCLEKLTRNPAIDEALILSTCNRLEIVVVSGNPSQAESAILSLYSRYIRFTTDEVRKNADVLVDDDAVGHIFRLVSGLESMVAGDAQILGQVKKAYQHAVERGTVGKTLHAVFQKAFNAAKKVRTHTGLGKGRISISALAVDFIHEIMPDISSAKVTVIGAGKMGSLCVKYLLDTNAKEIHIVNRSVERCEEWERFDRVQIHSLDKIEECLLHSDVVISATASEEPVITKKMVESAQAQDHKCRLLIDITVPVDIEPHVSDVNDVVLVGLDRLQSLAQQNSTKRANEIALAEGIVREALQDFGQWETSSRVNALTHQLGIYANRVLEEEKAALFDSLPGLTDEQRGLIEQQMLRMAERIVLKPRRVLRNAGKSQASPETLELIHSLFHAEVDTRDSIAN